MSNPEPLELFVSERVKMIDVPPGTPAPAERNTPLSFSVEEQIKTRDIPPGGQPLTKEQREEKLPPEEIEKRRKIMLEYTRLSGRYCAPHSKKSRWVEEADLPRVIADGKDLVAMCHIPRGNYSGISALAHSQIEDKDPLRFFVLPNGMVVINPVITSHTKVPIFKEEGCMSYPDREMKTMISRFNKVSVMYQTLARKDENSDPILSQVISEDLGGGPSHVFQHECHHLNGVNIYDENYHPETVVLFGDGISLNEEEIKKLYE